MIEYSAEQVLAVQKIYGQILKEWFEKIVDVPLIQLIETYPYPDRSVISFSHEIRLGDSINLRRHGKTEHELFSIIAWQKDYVINISLGVWARHKLSWEQFAKDYGFKLFDYAGVARICIMQDIELAIQKMVEERPEETIAGLI